MESMKMRAGSVPDMEDIHRQILDCILCEALRSAESSVADGRPQRLSLKVTTDEAIDFIRYADRRLKSVFKQILNGVDVSIVLDVDGDPLEGDDDEGIREEAS